LEGLSHLPPKTVPPSEFRLNISAYYSSACYSSAQTTSAYFSSAYLVSA
jgi:hypothetical protein